MAKNVVPARGMRDILPAEKRHRDRILSIIRETYRDAGFEEIETPAVEPLTRLLSGQGGENEKMIFEIMRRGLDPEQPVIVKDASDLGLRYDLTVPLTRYYATHAGQLPRVFRALQTGPVWRAERPQKGRFRQFRQCDIDIIGDPTITAEIDLLTTTVAAFEALGMGEHVKVLLNDRRVLRDLLVASGIPDDNHEAALIALDKRDKVGDQGVRSELLEKQVCTEEQADSLLSAVDFLRGMGGANDAPLRDGRVTLPNGAGLELYELPEIVRATRELKPDAVVEFDATLVRGMGYYTGPIFEVAHKDRNFSVAGGGRYDKVVGRWLGREVPACGFSIGFERIADLVQLPEEEKGRVALLYKPGNNPVGVLQLRQELQSAGHQVGMVVPPRRLKAQFFEALETDEYSHFVDARREDATVDELRPVRRDPS